MQKILRYRLLEILIDRNNTEGKINYHFIVLNEIDNYSLDPIMICLETPLTTEEILNRSYLIGYGDDLTHAIPTNRIQDIYTFEDKGVLDQYREQRRNVKTTREIQDERQADLNRQALSVSDSYRKNLVSNLRDQMAELDYKIMEAGNLTRKELEKERAEIQRRIQKWS